ncbi:MAG: SRPBCC family protein [Mycobacteriales bacterium]
MPELLLTTVIAASPDACFLLSLSVDAHTSSMGRSGERAVAGVRSGVLSLGDSVTWQARHFGVPFRMTSRITAYDQPSRFVDEQVRGPFAVWWHEHRFEEHDGRTVMTDLVRYRSPAGPLGALVDRLALERYMRRLLQTRNAWLKAELEAG